MSKTQWNLDPTHSEIGFKVKHLMITNVSGSFGKFNASAKTEGDDFTSAEIEFSAEIDSINTGNEQRDGHLKSPDFFDAASHPTLNFVSTKVEKKDDENYTVHGNLTVRGVSKPVALNVEHGGIGKDPWGNEKAGFSISGKINRAEFGLTWNAPLEAGGVLVSEDVKINGELQLVRG
ncbi:MAG: YceI family protein [Flavobacteriales bacterium]